MEVHVTVAGAVILAAAGLLAGAINAIAGGGSLLSFPALLMLGYPAVAANVANSVGLLPGYFSGSLGYREELHGQENRLCQLGFVSVVGAVTGAWLLLAGPATVFQRIVPWLILGSCALLAAQPTIARSVAARRRDIAKPRMSAALLAFQALAAIYGGYFGAGGGVIMLALLGIFLPDALQRVNALKVALSLIISVVSVAFFLTVAHVAWFAVGILAAASFVGGRAGVALARRLNDRVLRLSVIVFGVAVAIRLAL